LNRTPFWAPIVVPTIVAAGVANPSAQGQAINTDDAKTMSANSKTGPSCGDGATCDESPQQDYLDEVRKSREEVPDDAQRTAFAMTAGTKYAEMRSARFWMSGWRDWASLTVWDDLLERRVRTDLRRLNDEDTVLVNGGPDDLVALTPSRRGRTRR